MRDRKDAERGLLSLEASIALTIFIFLMLFLYSFFVVFEARNEIGHVLLTTASSLAKDPLANEAADKGSVQSLLYSLYGAIASSDGTYTETSKWYSDSAMVNDVVKARFAAYLAGGGETAANQILDRLHVVGGMDGIDFSGCTVSGSEIRLEVKYKIQYEFQVFGLKELEVTQSCCSRLWK